MKLSSTDLPSFNYYATFIINNMLMIRHCLDIGELWVGMTLVIWTGYYKLIIEEYMGNCGGQRSGPKSNPATGESKCRHIFIRLSARIGKEVP